MKKIIAPAFLIAVLSFACDFGTPLYNDWGPYTITLVGDSTRCLPEHQFFFFIDEYVVNDFSRRLPYEISVKGREYIVRAQCASGTTWDGWADTLTVTSDTTLTVSCFDCE